MNTAGPTAVPLPSRGAFLSGVFLITSSVLVFQIVQTRILSVMAWYHLAFFAISVAMLGMTVGAVWVYLRRDRFKPERLSTLLSDSALVCAATMPLSLMIQFSLITTMVPIVTMVVSWTFLMIGMAIPYVFAGITVSLALTRSPFPVPQVYGVDLLGAALGCVGVVVVLNYLDAPSTILLAGVVAALGAWAFARGATPGERAELAARGRWCKPATTAVLLALATVVNAQIPVGLKPMLVKDGFESHLLNRYEKWNSYSRIVATPPENIKPYLWGESDKLPQDRKADSIALNIDGAAGTSMFKFDGTPESVDFLRYDLVNLAYHLPGIRKAAIIGVGGGRDIVSAHIFGVPEIVGVELNPIFVRMHTENPFYKSFTNLTTIPNLELNIDDARSWFASTKLRFDLVQMSMIDTWAATGAGAFSLSENGLYTLEGWRAFLKTLNDDGLFTVSRWYSPDDVNESGRMVALAAAALLDAGISNPANHIYVASAERIATLVVSKRGFTPEQLQILDQTTRDLDFRVLISPEHPPESEMLREIVAANSIPAIDAVTRNSYLDLSVPTDNRPFFFNQLRFGSVFQVLLRFRKGWGSGVLQGNMVASASLLMILVISIVAVIGTILLPLRASVRGGRRGLIRLGTTYFALIGMGFMFTEISLLQYFSVFLGHPIYSLGVCLFSLILATGIGSLASGRALRLSSSGRFTAWGVIVGFVLLILQARLIDLFGHTTMEPLPIRILVSLAVVMPVGFLLGFAFPTGMSLVEAVDREPTPWFWGINGATGVLASVLAVMVGMAWGINVTMSLAALCYLALIPVAAGLSRLRPAPGS